jgi:A/G-specific adenine glycosylase
MRPRVPPSRRSAAAIRRRILAWYDAARRDLPWRGTTDPYEVLVSEVMLQQTQAARVAERYPRFLARFPTAGDLASASVAAVLAEWSGLGYNRRAIALREAAAAVARDGWPTEVAALERLPGIGPYTARAVASLAFGLPVGVVDTNVRRWLLRRLPVEDRPRELQTLSDALARAGMDRRAADWTHATMEFGAAVCRARAPRCGICPIARGCPSRDAPPAIAVARQPPLGGSDRELRGAIVRALGASPRHRRNEGRLRAELGPDDARWERIVERLARDRLVHRAARELRLGEATIEP